MTNGYFGPRSWAALLVVVGASCQEPAAPELDGRLGPEQAALARHAVRHVPFKLAGGATLVAQTFAPGFPAGTSDFGGRCSVPSHFVIRFTVAAEAAHLGRLVGDFEHCSRIDFQTGASTLTDGVAEMIAANGDELWASYRSADAPEGPFDERLTFEGGTGRFEGASGGALASAVCDRAAGTCAYRARGTLVYAASDRGR